MRKLIFSPLLASSPIMETYPQNITTLDGKDVTFQCKAVGAPSPDIQWMYNGK